MKRFFLLGMLGSAAYGFWKGIRSVPAVKPKALLPAPRFSNNVVYLEAWKRNIVS